MAIWVPLLLVVVVAFLLAALYATGDGTPVAAIVAGVILVWVGGLLTWGVRRNLRHASALEAATLMTDEGPFDWTTTLGEEWVGTIGAARFGIDRLATETLAVGSVYRVHYLPTDLGAWVMSIEPAGD